MAKASKPGAPKRKKKKAASVGSLLSPQATGGIVGGKGFDFQTRYAVCHIPVWLKEGPFHQFFFEGTGDIDIRFLDAGISTRVHIQVKDHEVTASELKTVIKQFKDLDAQWPGIYKRFTLACPSLAAKVQAVENGLSRFRNAKPFYDDAANALNLTRADLDARLDKAGLKSYGDFIAEKVFVEIGHGDLHHDDRALDVFVARLLAHPEYAGKVRAMVQPAFAELIRAIGANKGKVLERDFFEKALRQYVAADLSNEKQITFWVHNWTLETFDVAADYTLDWSPHFDRATRKVPLEKTWNEKLFPELKTLKGQILSSRGERVIRYRGKCALTTGIALGATFPGVGGWIFEIPQPPAKGAWRSDAVMPPGYNLQIEKVDGSSSGDDVVVALNIKGDGRKDVMDYVATTGRQPKLFAFLSPPSQGGQAIGGAEEACAFAAAVREELGKLLKEHGVRSSRLFFYGPFALAVFLGQHLTSIGTVQLFEFQDPGYVPSMLLQT